MNPGIIVAGGGGAGGGSGAGGGKGKGKKKKAKGEGDEENAEGGKKNAADGTGECGGSGGCPNPAHGNGGSASAGDPVDVVTGRVYTLPSVDLALPGHVPLIIERRYNSLANQRDVGLGFGWTHSLAWEVELRRRSGKVWTPQGTFWEFEVPKPGQRIEFDTAVLDRIGDNYSLFNQEDGYTYLFAAEKGASDRLLLREIRNRYGFGITLSYHAGALLEVKDSVGRTVAVRRATDGRIAAFEVLAPDGASASWCFRRYRYDERGDLIATSDADGNVTAFDYDAHHRLLKKTNPEGFEVHHRYDRQGRCFETWCSYPGQRNPALSNKAPKVLADGSPAKGMLHVTLNYLDETYTEVVTSRTVRRYHTNAIGKVDLTDSGAGVHTTTYDEHGKIATYTNAEQATWKWERDEHGNVVSTLDPLGFATSSSYDDRGYLVQRTDENGVSHWYERDEYGALLAARDAHGQLVASCYDAAGNPTEVVLPNGGVTHMEYDAMGNRVVVQEPNGGTRHIEYDYLGRVVGMTDEVGGKTRYIYGARGELLVTEFPNGARSTNGYDREGNLTHFTTPDSRTYELRYAALGLVYQVRKPDGTRANFRYDREGDLVEVHNEKGEQHVIERSFAGYIVEEVTFDGRRMRYRFDAGGQLTSVTEPSGETTQIEYDPKGRISGRSYADGSEDRFEYDGVGHLLFSDNGSVACRFEYDDRGNLTREYQTFEGETYVLEHDHDAMGHVRETRSSLGYHQAIGYDLMGNLESLQMEDQAPLRFQRDVLGQEVARLLPGGGRLDTSRDVLGLPQLRRLSMAASTLAPGVDSGVDGRATVHEQAYVWSQGGKLTSTIDSEFGGTEYQYDPVGQLTGRLPAHAQREIFSYEPGGNLHDDQAHRDYELGGRLVRRGNTSFVYDAAHRVTEKHVDTDQGKQVWRYAWDGRGLLRKITSPDGSSVENTYDSYARRIQKRRLSNNGAVLSVTRYVWNGDHIVHELQDSANDNAHTAQLTASGAGSPSSIEGVPDSGATAWAAHRRETTYAFVPGSLQPLAHRTVQHGGGAAAEADAGGGASSPWVHYIEGNAGNPQLLVAGDGRVLAHLDGKAYGQVAYADGAAAATDLRFYGHIEDAETGLFYNGYRHYDPETGRYLSPEPLGLMGGLSPFGYAANDPIGMVDPDGLAPVVATCVGTQPNTQGINSVRASSGSTAWAEKERRKDERLHPVVENALLVEKETLHRRAPSSCGDPAAVSDYLKAYEAKHGQLDPDDKAGVARALGGFKFRAKEEGGAARSPCSNCSQMFANLMATYGKPDPTSIQPGLTSSGTGKRTNFQSPTPAQLEANPQLFTSYDQALAQFEGL